MTETDDPSPAQHRPKRRFRFLRRFAQTLLVLGIGAGALLFWAQGRSLVAPEWIRTAVEERVNAQLEDGAISVGDAVVVLEDGWKPRFQIRDLVLRSAAGAEVVTFSQVGGGLDLEALRAGQAALTSLDVSGVFVTLRRTSDGGVALSTGAPSDNTATRQAANISELIASLDEYLLRPSLAKLTDAQINGVTLRYEDDMSNRAWTVDGGRFRMTRDGTALQLAADLAVLGGGTQVATLEMNYSGVIGSVASDIGITFSDIASLDIASQSPAFSWLAALDAPISGSFRGGLTETGALKPINVSFEVVDGAIQPQPEARPIPLSVARSYFTYLPSQQLLRFDEFIIESAWGSGIFEGSASIGTGDEGAIGELVGQFRSGRLTANPMGLYDAPVSIEAAEIDFRMKMDPFLLEIGRLSIKDEGSLLSVKGQLAVGQEGWDIDLDAEMNTVDPGRLLELWPVIDRGRKTRKWISENVRKADVSEIQGALRLVQGQKPNLYLGFDFENADFRFMKRMPDLMGGKGYATLIDGRFVAQLDKGRVVAPEGGVVDATGTSFIIPDVTAKPNPPGIVRLNASGPVTAALSLLDQPPLEIMSKSGRPVDLAEGNAEIAGTIAFPMRKNVPIDQVQYDITGDIFDVTSDKLVADRIVSSDRLALVASETAIDITGPASLDGVPLTMTWSRALGAKAAGGEGQLVGTVALDAEALETLGIRLPPGSVSGSGLADVVIDMSPDAPPRLTLASDLQGIALSIPQVQWRKAAETSAELELEAMLGDVPSVERLVLSAPGLSATGSVLLAPEGQMERVRFDRLRLGNWFDGAVDLVGRGAGRPPGVVIRGGTLDLRRADFSGGGGGASTPLTVRLDRLQVSDTIAITAMSGNLTTGSSISGQFEGAINGAARISGQLVPKGARSAILLESSDAGSVFASAGLTQRARGGAVELELTPVGTGGAFDGTLEVKDTRIKDAPAIAAMLNAISIVGLVNELSGDGIYFSDIKADFRMSPSQVTLRDASAVGPSMGLSMDGVFVPDTGRIEMQGVISPIYLLNAVGSLLTREGEGLFGFNYSITGTAADPEVFVNPLTALAPAMFRNLFRRAAPDVPLEAGEAPPPPPPPKPTLEERRERR